MRVDAVSMTACVSGGKSLGDEPVNGVDVSSDTTKTDEPDLSVNEVTSGQKEYNPSNSASCLPTSGVKMSATKNVDEVVLPRSCTKHQKALNTLMTFLFAAWIFSDVGDRDTSTGRRVPVSTENDLKMDGGSTLTTLPVLTIATISVDASSSITDSPMRT